MFFFPLQVVRKIFFALSGCIKHAKFSMLANWNVERGKINIDSFEIYRSHRSFLYSIHLAKKCSWNCQVNCNLWSFTNIWFVLIMFRLVLICKSDFLKMSAVILLFFPVYHILKSLIYVLINWFWQMNSF